MFRHLTLASLFCLLAAAPLLAQSGLGSITGTVQDTTGGVFPAATVRLTEQSTGAVRIAAKKQAGLFTFTAVQVGTYTVTVSHTGFKEKKIENIGINAFQQVALGGVVLDVGTSAETITVSATAEQALVKDSA